MKSDAPDLFERIWPLAEGLGVSKDAFRKWPSQGLPHKYMLPLLKSARDLGVSLSEDELLSATRDETKRKCG